MISSPIGSRRGGAPLRCPPCPVAGDPDPLPFRSKSRFITMRRSDCRTLRHFSGRVEIESNEVQVVRDHEVHQLVEGCLRLPTQLGRRLGGVRLERLDLGRPEVGRVDLREWLAVEADEGESQLQNSRTVWASPVPIT